MVIACLQGLHGSYPFPYPKRCLDKWVLATCSFYLTGNFLVEQIGFICNFI